MEEIKLPEFNIKGCVEGALNKRKSIRKYKNECLTLKEISQILWSAYGINENGRTVPSAGGIYPLKIYILIGNCCEIDKGLYCYIPDSHSLIKILSGEFRKELSLAALSQKWIEEAPATLIICADYEKMERIYGKRGIMYTLIEVGHVGENVYIQCESLNLGTVGIGAFENEKVRKILKLDEEPVYLMPVGKR